MPLRVRVSLPVVASHSFTVLSRPAEASRFPSGLNATLHHHPGMPPEGEGFLPGRGVPQPSPCHRGQQRRAACRRG